MNGPHDRTAACTMRSHRRERKRLIRMTFASGTDDATASTCAIRACPHKEIPVNQPNNQNDKKDTQSQPTKAPVVNPSQPDQKPGDKQNDPKTGSDKR